MPSISIVTPWHGETGDLLADFYQAVQGSAQVVVVDNACPNATATALSEMTAHLCGEYVRNEENRGFAAANNQGYAKATGDIVVFLNSDVAPAGPWLAQVASQVKDGSLYGPSLQVQLVAGRHIPYLEGWCVAATRKTWERLDQGGDYVGWHGPWDQEAFPGPYWEDNDLCLRALQAGIGLVHTTWPIQHKGGRTAGPIVRHAESFARNEGVFTQRVLAAFGPSSDTLLYQRYLQACYTPSDIQHHLGLLYSLARGNVVELGTRSGVSTSALLAGVEAKGGHVWSVDLEDCGALFDSELWTFARGDSRYPTQLWDWSNEPSGFIDLLFIDTEHQYEVTQAELAAWHAYMAPGSHILLHDTETFPGVRRAVEEFCEARGWGVVFVLPCNGMAIVEVSSGE